MLESDALTRIQKHQGEQLQRWLKEHVEPRLALIGPRYELYGHEVVAAILDKAISPLVYWVRDQPSSSNEAPRSPVGPAPSGGSSLSTWPPQEFLSKWDLSCDGQTLGKQVIWPNQFLGRDFKTVDTQLVEWGYRSFQEQDKNGKRIYGWERLEPAP